MDIIIEEMEPNHSQIFIKGQLNVTTMSLIKSRVKRNGQEIIVQIFQNGLTQYNLKDQPLQSINFNFEIKFTFSTKPPEMSFEKDQAKVTYQLQSQIVVEKWRSLLRLMLNQRGFHEQFKPIKKIGKGNFASVYLAQKLQTKTNFAVKAFSKQAAYSEDKGKQCLIKEIQVMRHLNNKNTMRLYQVFQSQNSLYIIFQLLEGGQLYDKIKAKYKFKNHEIQLIIKGILQGLREMHSKNIMHRDLKPQNLLFRKEGDFDCVIADFGLAEFSDISQYLFVRCGTPGYVAPQVINIKDMKTKYKPICDIFSLGLIFHLLILGRSAFPGVTYNQVLSQNRASIISFTEQDRKKLGQEAMDLLQKMLKKNPLERISAEESLKHPYFNITEEDEEEKLEKVDINTINSSPSQQRKNNQPIQKDSCVSFKMGKENVMTGKTETVSTMGSKISGIDNSQTIKKTKMSAFCAQKK